MSLKVLLAACFALQSSGVEWHAPQESCPSQEQVDARLTTLMGGAELVVAAQAQVSETASGWELDLQIDWDSGGGERRQLVAETCEELAEATLVVLALLAKQPPEIEPEPGSVEPPLPEPPRVEQQPAAPEPAPEREPVVAPQPDRTPRPPERKRPPRRRALALTLGGLGSIGGGSSPGFGVRLGLVGWLGRRLRLVAEGRYLPPRATGPSEDYTRFGRIQLGYAHLAACVNLARGRIEVPICGAAELGGLRASGFGVAADRGASDLWVAAAVSTAVAIRLVPKFALVLGIEVVAPLTPQEYVYGAQSIYQTPLPGGRALLGFEFRFANKLMGEAKNP